MPRHWSDEDVDELLVEVQAAPDYREAALLREKAVDQMERRAERVPGTQHRVKGLFPYDEGDVTVLGPEVFVARDSMVLSWRGVNYVPQPAHRVPRAQLPTIGRTVWYRSRTGAYTVPAVVTATTESLDPEMVERKLIPALSSPMHVHLTVQSPGLPVIGPNHSLDALGDPPQVRELPAGARSFNLAGTYQEWNVRFHEPGLVPLSCAPIPADGENEQLAGSWTWPVVR